MRFGLKERLEGQRTNELIKLHQNQFDLGERDNIMLLHPDWKPIQKNKWVDLKRPFTNITKGYTGPGQEQLWPEIPLVTHDKYIDGLEVMGDLSRRRDRSREPKQELITTVKPDSMGDKLTFSNSLRTFNQDKVLGLD